MTMAHGGILAVQITAFGKLLGASLYEQLVNVPNILKDIPQSLEEARLFWSSANPGNYFWIVAPLAQISALISLILGWRSRDWRPFLLAAFILIVVAEAITFTFHYPRTAILITQPLVENQDLLHQTVSEWALGNWVRIVMVLGAVVA